MILAIKALAIWFMILVLAVANGILREALLVPGLGRTPGLVLSGLLLSVLILLVTLLAVPWLQITRWPQAVGVGLGWLALTLTFEFAFGRLQGKSWSALLEAYTFKDGNIWPVVLLITAAAPYLAARFRGLLP